MTPAIEQEAPGRPTRAAVLVVHGIGDQSPYSTLDRVVRGLRTVLGSRVAHLGHTSAAANGRVASGVRFSLNTPLPRSQARELDVFEGYWAPMSMRFTTTRGLLAWVKHMLLAPFRQWSQVRLDHVSLGRRLELVTGEVLVALFTIAVLVVGGAVLAQYGEELFQNPLDDYDPALSVAVELAAAIAAMAFLARAFGGTLGAQFRGLRRRGHVWYVTRVLGEKVTHEDDGLQDRAAGELSRRIWGRAAWVGLAVAAAVVVLVELLADPVERPDSGASDESEGKALPVNAISDFDKSFWIALLIFGIAFAGYRVLSAVAGDIAVYVADDDATATGRLRNHILTSIENQLRGLLEDPTYDRVHVIAHSLGTVVTYDAINRLRQEIEHQATHDGGADDDLLDPAAYDRFGSYLTVACPLDLIAYGFRSDGDETNPIQRQLIERRRALRTRNPLFDAGRFSLDEDFQTASRTGYYPIEPADFAWLNIRAWPDPVSRPLLNFRPDEQTTVRFSPVTFAHTKVLDDRRTYERMLPYL